jgi:hypothetical protein
MNMGKRFKGQKAVIFAVLIIFGLYLFTRLVNLTLIPIFTDEAIYIRWGLIGSRDAAQRLISLEDGKQPFFTWVMMVLFKIYPGDPLVTGRLASVIAGLFSLSGIMLLTGELFRRKKAAVLSGLFYLVSPFFLMYDRLALYDSWVAALSIWNLYLSVLLVRYLRLDIALILALTLGAATLNKSSGFLSIFFLPALLLILPKNKEKPFLRIVRFAALSLLAAGLAQIYYSVLRLSPLFHIVGQKNNVFVYPFAEWLKHPFEFLLGNLRGMFDWLVTYISPPVFWLGIGSVFRYRKFFREKLLLLGWWLFPFVSLAAFAKVLYPRFVLFMSVPLLILAAAAVSDLSDRLRNKFFLALLYLAAFVPVVYTSYFVITDPWYAHIPEADKGQILNDWPAGGGVKEVKDLLIQFSQAGPISVYTDGTFGLLPYAVEIYTIDQPDIFVKGIWPVPEQIPPEILESAGRKPTYVIMNQSATRSAWPLELVSEYEKGTIPGRTLRLYRVVPSGIFQKRQPDSL